MKLNKLKIFVIAVITFFISVNQMNAQSTTAQPDFPSYYYTILALGLLTIIVAIIMGFFIFGMGEGKENVKVNTKSAKAGIFAKVRQKLTASTPIDKEEEIVLDHNFDGIKELDNRIPPWFSYLFYITIIFGVYYMLDYHVFSSDKLMYDEYAQEIKIAAEQRAELEKSGVFVNESNVVVLNDAAAIISGKKIFDINCIACHASGGAGLVGPNLTDEYWIHGGGVQNIFKTVKYGVPAKGMISWQTQLNPKQIQEVASYIISLQGTNPPNAKQPQGEKYIPASGTGIRRDSLKTASL